MAPVHDAARRNDVEALQVLLDADPGVVEAEEEVGWWRWRPLYLACEAGHAEAAHLLLDRGAGGINTRHWLGSTPFVAACSSGSVETVRLLLARGADVSVLSRAQTTVLMGAACCHDHPGTRSDHAGVMRLLIKAGRMPVDARGPRGCTALSEACSYGSTEGARVLLVEGGADHTIANHEGDTPMALAGLHGHYDCVRLIEWYEGELEKAWLLSKARAVVEDSECISRAAEKAGTRTQAEVQASREETAPAYLRGRVGRGEALPVLEVVGQKEEKRWRAVFEYVVMRLKDDLFIELMDWVRFR